MSTKEPKKKTPWEQYLDDLVWTAFMKSVTATPDAEKLTRAGLQESVGNSNAAKELYQQGKKADDGDVAHEITKFGTDMLGTMPISNAIIGTLGTLPLGGRNIPFTNQYVSYAPMLSGAVDTLANTYYAKAKADSAGKPYGFRDVVEDAFYNAMPNMFMAGSKVPNMKLYASAKVGSRALGKTIGELGSKAYADEDDGYEPDYVRRD